jgi:hypothetical protein
MYLNQLQAFKVHTTCVGMSATWRDKLIDLSRMQGPLWMGHEAASCRVTLRPDL